MKTIEWVVIGGVVIIGLYFSGVLTKLIPSLHYPSQGRILPPSEVREYMKMSGTQQVAYMPPHNDTRRVCYRGICTDVPTFNQTFV